MMILITISGRNTKGAYIRYHVTLSIAYRQQNASAYIATFRELKDDANTAVHCECVSF